MAYTLVNMPTATTLVAIPRIPLTSVEPDLAVRREGAGVQADYALVGSDLNRKVLLSVYTGTNANNDTRRMSVSLVCRAVETDANDVFVRDRPFRVTITVDKPSITEGSSQDVLNAVLTAVSAFFHDEDDTTKVASTRVVDSLQAGLLSKIFTP